MLIVIHEKNHLNTSYNLIIRRITFWDEFFVPLRQNYHAASLLNTSAQAV